MCPYLTENIKKGLEKIWARIKRLVRGGTLCWIHALSSCPRICYYDHSSLSHVTLPPKCPVTVTLIDHMKYNTTNRYLLRRRRRQFWWWWWSSVCPGCPTTSSTCGWSSALSLWTRPPSSSGWWLTAWPTATPPSTPSSTLSCPRTSGLPTSRCSGAGCPAGVPWTTPGTSAAEWRRRRPPTSAWPTKLTTPRSVRCFDVAADGSSVFCEEPDWNRISGIDT